MKIKDGAIAKYAYFNIMDFKFALHYIYIFFAISLQKFVFMPQHCLMEIMLNSDINFNKCLHIFKDQIETAV